MAVLDDLTRAMGQTTQEVERCTLCCMSATRTQVYLTTEQRAGLDERARTEGKTMAHVIRDAVDTYLAADVDAVAREQLLADTFGSCPDLAGRVPSRDEWDRSSTRHG